jgi:hypothetical protein
VSVTERVAALLADAEARAARADWDGAARAWMRVAEMALAGAMPQCPGMSEERRGPPDEIGKAGMGRAY